MTRDEKIEMLTDYIVDHMDTRDLASYVYNDLESQFKEFSDDALDIELNFYELGEEANDNT